MELLESGPEPDGHRPRWLMPVLTGGLVAALVVVLVTRAATSEVPDAASATPTSAAASQTPAVASASPTPEPVVAPSTTSTTTPQPWPSRSGACGSVAWVPLTKFGTGDLPDVDLLVGGPALMLVDVSARKLRTLWRAPHGDSVTDLQTGPGGRSTYLVSAPCAPDRPATVWQLSSPRRPVRPVAGSLAVPWLIPGSMGPWQVSSVAGLDDAGSDGVHLREAASGASARLPAMAQPMAVVDAGVVVASGSAADNTPRTQLWSRSSRLLHDYGPGWPLGVAPDGNLLSTGGGCALGDGGHACELRLLGLPSGRLVTRYPLPAGQYVTSAVAFDSAARRAAFALSLPAADVPYDTGHPFPSSRLVILDLRTGALTAVPGVELAPKTGAGLALAPNGWLFATLSLGDHGELLAWHIGLPAPVHLHDIPGPLTQAPPVRIVAPE